MPRLFVIERDLPGVGGQDATWMEQAARASNEALAQLAGVQWRHSYVTADRMLCIYLAEHEELLRRHARLSGFPANRVTEVVRIIDPTTGRHRE